MPSLAKIPVMIWLCADKEAIDDASMAAIRMPTIPGGSTRNPMAMYAASDGCFNPFAAVPNSGRATLAISGGR